MFFVGSAALVAIAYTLDKRFKANAPPSPPAGEAAAAPQVSAAAASVMAPSVAAAPAVETPGATPVAAAPPVMPSEPPAALLPITDLKAEHARLTRDLTDRVDDDEDVRFEKFMRMRRIEEEIERLQPPA
jgi:hypothetical protein